MNSNESRLSFSRKHERKQQILVIDLFDSGHKSGTPQEWTGITYRSPFGLRELFIFLRRRQNTQDALSPVHLLQPSGPSDSLL